MDALAALVRDRDTELGRTARAALAGFVATLRAAGEGTADGRATAVAEQLAALMTQEEELTSGGRGSGRAADRVGGSAGALPSQKDPWLALRSGWRARGEWKSILGEQELPADADARGLWLLTHHLPPAVAAEWQAEWVAASGRLPTDTPATFAGPFDWLLLPPLAEVPAVRLSPSAPPDPRVPTDLGGLIARQLAPVLSAVLTWIDHDTALRHMLRGVYRFGTSPLYPAHKARYERALIDRFGSLCEAEAAGDGTRVVHAWIDFDEAVNSLVPVPPAHPTSAVAGLGRACREALPAVRATAADRQVHIQIPAGKYADVRGVTDPDQDVEATAGAAPGEIVLCARAFLRLDGQTHPGRVLFRPR